MAGSAARPNLLSTSRDSAYLSRNQGSLLPLLFPQLCRHGITALPSSSPGPISNPDTQVGACQRRRICAVGFDAVTTALSTQGHSTNLTARLVVLADSCGFSTTAGWQSRRPLKPNQVREGGLGLRCSLTPHRAEETALLLHRTLCRQRRSHFPGQNPPAHGGPAPPSCHLP